MLAALRKPAIQLPLSIVEGSQPPVWFIATHGTNSDDPRKTSHVTGPTRVKGMFGRIAAELNVSYITYTARGYGESKGWQGTTDMTPFTWEHLADDMIRVADMNGVDKFIAGGMSLGAATALYCALRHPDRVIGLVLDRMPAAWELRAARRKDLIRSAESLSRGGKYKFSMLPYYEVVVKGTAFSDLPSKRSAVYGQI